MSTLKPRPAYTDAELALLYPPQLRLQQVQVLLRHGERTPVNARFANAGLPAFWPYCSAVRRLRSAVLTPDIGADSKSSSGFSVVDWQRRLETFGPDDAAVPAAGPDNELDGICDMGMLTDRGRETTYALGARLRRLYVDRLGFLPATMDGSDDSSLYLRATPVPRALESMQQTFHGLYPPHTRGANPPPLAIVSRSPADETLFPNDGNCRRFAALSRAFAQRAAERWNDSDEMAYLDRKLGRWMPDDSPRVAVDSRPRLSGIMDSVNSTSAHGPATRLPGEFYDPKVKQILEKIGVEEWYAGYKESQEYRTLGIGGLMGDIVARMVGSAEGERGQQPLLAGQGSSKTNGAIRFGLSGCHDTTLAGVLASLGAFNDDAWPPFTSHVAIELFRSADQPSTPTTASVPRSSSSWWPSILGGGGRTSSAAPIAGGIGRKPTSELSDEEKKALQGYFVRIRYNDTTVTVPGCKPQGRHLDGDESFCTLEAFKSIVDKFTPRDWKLQCRADVKAPAFPAKPQPAGY